MTTSQLKATMSVALPEPARVMEALLDHFHGHGEVTRQEDGGSIRTQYGVADVAFDATTLIFNVQADEDAGLAFMKYAIAEHVIEFAGKDGSAPKLVWEGDGAAGTPLAYLRVMEVVSTTNITPHMRRVRLKGDDLQRYARGGLHIRLLFPPKTVAEPKWPVMGEDGRPVWPDGDYQLTARVYTIRAVDVIAGHVDIDMVVHGDDSDAPGSNWAMNTKPGDIVGMTGPGGGNAADAADWYLLAGDETALPAIGRIVERLPETARVLVRIEIDSAAEEQVLVSKANLDVQWLHRNGREAGTTTLLEDAVKAVDFPDPDSNLNVWVGCEFDAFRNIRSFIRKEKNIARDKHLVVAYWRRGVEGDNARRGARDD